MHFTTCIHWMVIDERKSLTARFVTATFNTVLLGKSSAECLRRFRSVSPIFKSAEESLPSEEQCAAEFARYRSHSYPSSNLCKKDAFDNSRTKRSLSTEEERGNFENVAEYYGRDKYGIENSIKCIKSQVANVPRGRQILRTSKERPQHKVNRTQFAAYVTENPTIARKAKAKAKVVSELNNLNNSSMVHKSKLGEYYLKDSKPGLKENVFKVFDYYSEQHRWKDTKVLPHLQPYNLKPYGTGENLVFPVYNVNRKREIVYPDCTEANDPFKRKNESSNKSQTLPAPSPTLHREFCTTPRSNEQETNCKALVPEHKPKQTNLVLQKDRESGNILETANSQSKIKAETSSISKDLQKCNEVISEYRKLNPNYKFNKTELKSGSAEEKEAVNNAVSFATNFKKYFINSNKVETSDKILSLKNKTVSDIQVREHHEGGVEAKESSPTEEIDKDSGAPSINSLLQSSSQPAIERKKYSFAGATLNFPEVPITPVRVRVGPKANLLQSSAPPEAAKCWDDIQLEKNERLVSPWPSYSDQIKGLFPQKDATRIKYPLQSNNLKTIKNTTNLQIQQSASNQPKLELNSRSLHKNIKVMETDDATQTDESFQKKLFHYCKNKIKSLPDLRRFSTTRKGNGNEETVAQKRSPLNNKGNPVCDSTEFDTPPKTTEYFDKQDCFCIEPKLPTYAPPLKRLGKIRIEEPPRICPIKDESKPSTTRADDGFKIKLKKLPEINPVEDCKPPCVPLKEGCPLHRLKKKHIEEPLKICPHLEVTKVDCPLRADAGLEIKQKCLPKLVPSVCPNLEIEMQDCPPLKPLKKVNIPEPVRVCPLYVELSESHCPVRADENLLVEKKELPKLKPSECPHMSQVPPESAPLRRLGKLKNIDTPRECPIVEHPTVDEPPPRADANIKIKQKKLQPHIPSPECQPCELTLKPGHPLRRLKKVKVDESPRICPSVEEEEVYEFPPRADDGMKVKIGHLPTLQAGSCPYIEQSILDVAPIKPLKKIKISEPEERQPVCKPEEPCPPRADAGMVSKRKTLPQLEVLECPYIPNVPTKDICPLKPLRKVKIAQPIQCAPESPPEKQPCPTRADDSMVMTKRSLPKLQTSDCPCTEETILKDVPLRRLKKVRIEEPPRICIEEDPCKDPSRRRSDDICGYTVERKTLPPMLLKPENNHISTKKKMKKQNKSPTVNVSHKRKFSLYSKMNQSWKTRRILSAINFNMQTVEAYSKKSDKDPDCHCPETDAYDKKYIHENPGCCCPEDQFPQTDVTPKLKRLPKFKKEDKDWSKMDTCLPKCRNPRADDSLKPKKKHLPRLRPSKCPCKESKDFENPIYPKLKRLGKFRKDDIDWAKRKECLLPCRNPRADDNWRIKKKRLPKLKSKHCPCTEYAALVDVPPLKRLPKFEKPDIDWEKRKQCLPPCRNIRADASLKPKEKCLPRLKISKCPCVEDNFVPSSQPELKRLGKFEKPDIDWSVQLECLKPCRNPRSDDNWKSKKKTLPKIKSSNCPCVNLTSAKFDVPPLKRLAKFPKPDYNWKDFLICLSPCRNPRADDNLKRKSKSLPLLKLTKCPCIELDDPPSHLPTLKRLPKFEKPDKDWQQFKICQLPCRNRRADENWKLKRRPLPKLEASDCPCLKIDTPKYDVEPLKRLPKFKKEDINWKVILKCMRPCDLKERADDKLKVKEKRLPLLKVNKCPCIEHPEISTYDPRMKRLPKFEKPDIDWSVQLECLKPCRNPRADDNWKRKKKSLPKIKSSNCPCVNLNSAKFDVPPLKRLAKFPKPDINWKDFLICLSPCRNPRADDNLKRKSKSLPLLKLTKCPCIELDDPPSYLPTLKRLPRFEKPDKDWQQFKACQLPCRNRRADENWKLRRRPLPKLEASDCPCLKIDTPKYDVEPLKRLPKFKKEDINWKILLRCMKPCDLKERADDKLKVREKRLPLLKVNKCPCIEHPETPTYDPQMKRLYKFEKPDIDWAALLECQKPCRNPRSDDNWRMGKKRLPKIKSSTCSCVNLSGKTVDVEPLKRLPKFKKEDKDWASFDVCKIPCRTPRADETLKIKDKRLPLLRPSKCPCIEHPEIPGYDPQLKRLRKFKKPDVDWESLLRCQKPCGKMPRADDKWRMRKKRLPKIKISKCPCLEPEEMVDVEPLKRLRKFKKEDKDWKSLEVCKPPCRNPRADANLKIKSKSLPLLRPSKCPCVEEKIPCKFSPELKRLTKLKEEADKGDINWETVNKCLPPCRNERADNLLGYKVKKKKLPPLIQKKCYHTSYTIHRTLMTSPVKLQKKTDECERAKVRLANSGVKSVKECQKKEMVVKKVCPEKFLKGCPAPDKVAREGCQREYKFVKCAKQKSPYPSFSECGTLYDSPSCECLVDYKILQPKYPIIEKLNLLEPPPPEHAHIDRRKERNCLLAKLGKRHQGMTKTCDTFNCPDNNMVGMGRLRKKQRENLQEEEVEDESSALVCSSKVAKTSETPKTGNEEKSLWRRICDYFKPRPDCPKPGEWKQKKLVEDAQKAANAAGLTLCKPKECEPKTSDPCKNLYAKSNKCGKSRKSDPCKKPFPKKKRKSNPCRGRKSRKTDPCKNPFPKGKDSSKKNKCKDPIRKKGKSHGPCKLKKKPKKACERKIVKEEDEADTCIRAKSKQKTSKPNRRK
ncbi:hypothetical protein ILUMI_09354, partial [Ignelater luminosus]